MANLYDYLAWRGDLTFSQAPLNEVDSLIFSWLSYAEWGDALPAPGKGQPVPLRDAAARFLALTHRNTEDKNAAYSNNAALTGAVVARIAGKTRRFGEVAACGFVDEIDEKEQKQFSAVTFLPGETAFIAFRGTDSTFVGWHENCNLSLSRAVPAQVRASEYLSQVPQIEGRMLDLGGHSKGGNLAVYAGVKCEESIRRRIRTIWNFDGPGFGDAFLEDQNYLSLLPRIQKIVPEDSVVGMIFAHKEQCRVVKSTRSGLFQHNGVLWEVLGDHFIAQDELSLSSRAFDKNVEEWMRDLDEEQRKEFIEALFFVLDATGAERLEELSAEGLGGAVRALKALSNMEDESKRMLLRVLGGLIHARNNALYQQFFAPQADFLRGGQKKFREFVDGIAGLLGLGDRDAENQR